MSVVLHKNIIIKIGAIIMNDDQEVLVVHKRGKPENEYIVPGGVQERGEDDEATLRRELKEELCIEIDSFKYFATYFAKALYEDCMLEMRVYFVEITNIPSPSQEIDAIKWVREDFASNGLKYGSILGEKILPSIYKSQY